MRKLFLERDDADMASSFSLPAGDWFCKHSLWISKGILGRAPNPRDMKKL